MPKRNHSLDDLSTFVSVAQYGSLSGAAQELEVPTSTVSRRVARLEDALGVSLLHREHRRVGLTADGEAVFARARPLLRELDELARNLRHGDTEVRGTLRVTGPAGLMTKRGFGEFLSSFRATFPSVHLQLTTTNRVVDLVESGVDIALRPYTPMTASRDADLRMRRLGSTSFGLFAAPDQPVTIDDLEDKLIGHPILRFAPQIAQRFGGWASLVNLSVSAEFDDFDSIAVAAAAGVGVGLLPRLNAEPLLRDGQLVRVLKDLDLGGSEMCLMWPASRHLAPRVRAFIDHCVAWAPRFGLQPSGTALGAEIGIAGDTKL